MLRDYLFQTATFYRKSKVVFSATDFVGTTTVSYTPVGTCILEYSVTTSTPVTVSVVGSASETVTLSPSDTYKRGSTKFSSITQISVAGATVSSIQILSKDEIGNDVWGLHEVGTFNVRLCMPKSALQSQVYGTVVGQDYRLVFIQYKGIQQGDLMVVDNQKYRVEVVRELYKKNTYHHSQLVVVYAQEEVLP